MQKAEIICDSLSPAGKRLTTYKLRYPKFIHAEFMTHRQLSRNASSSRAIPTAKYLEEVRSDELRAAPIFWGANQKGMQAVEELSDEVGIYGQQVPANGKFGPIQPASEFSAKQAAHVQWNLAAEAAANHAEFLLKIGAHKQLVNRVLEPFVHINVVATATEWDNFFGLRLHKDAQPEMRALAVAMWEAREESEPVSLEPGDWHLPFVDLDQEFAAISGWLLHNNTLGLQSIELGVRISVARCARVSYESFETGKRSTVDEDLKLYDRLVGAHPLHASPAEHQATPDVWHGVRWEHYEQHGNFVGWRQYRKMLPSEACAPLPDQYRFPIKELKSP